MNAAPAGAAKHSFREVSQTVLRRRTIIGLKLCSGTHDRGGEGDDNFRPLSFIPQEGRTRREVAAPASVLIPVFEYDAARGDDRP